MKKIDKYITEEKKKISDQQYKKIDNDFFICAGILIYGERLVSEDESFDKIFWLDMDKEREENVNSCRGCAIAVNAPPMKFALWPKTDKPWSSLHIDFVGSMKG